MKAAVLSILLILATALRLAAGPHPCTGSQQPARPAPAEHAACHEAGGDEPAASAPDQRPQDDDGRKAAEHALCAKACQALAVIRTNPALPEARLSYELPTASSERSVPLFVLSIDHIPLV